MRGIIWYLDKEKSEQIFNRILDLYESKDIKSVSLQRRKEYSQVAFENGDYWQTISANTSGRGLACNVAFIQKEINKQVVDIVIRPTVKSRPYVGYYYY